ncbi:MAG: hydantoinase/oxoprolinase N-terminal domain-containing protein [Pseudobdellovibrionaceae bacterium]
MNLKIFHGEYFAELELSQEQSKSNKKNLSPKAFKRIFLQKEPLKTALPEFLKSQGVDNLQQVQVAGNYFLRPLHLRLGGSVAQIVTAGWENWMEFEDSNPTYKVSNPDLVFALEERISWDGHIHQPFNPISLEPIIAALKKREVERVCLNLIHFEKNPTHLDQVKQILLNENFEVFTPESSDLHSWRKNAINAGLSKTFKELKQEIQSVLEPFSTEQVIFFGKNVNDKTEDLLENNSILDRCFSFLQDLQSQSPTNQDTFYAGLERFIWIASRPYQNSSFSWLSPWGVIHLKTPAFHFLHLQGTSPLDLGYSKQLQFEKKPEGFEPGPFIWGLGQKILWLDVFLKLHPELQIESFSDRRTPAAESKLDNFFTSLSRASSHSPKNSGQDVFKMIYDNSLHRLNFELSQLKQNDKLNILGPCSSIGTSLQ